MTARTERQRVVILGAAGRDFHNFNLVYRDDPAVEVVAFTATQIPGIESRRYPPALAGSLYSDGIPIVPEAELEALCREHAVDLVVFAYSDVRHETVMHLASRALACGADFALLGPRATLLRATRPVISVTAVRTGCGKSQIARWLTRWLMEQGRHVAVARHPMPYGDLAAQAVQRFASLDDMDTANCTQEEREEYEPYIAMGGSVFAGVDYAAVLDRMQAEAEIIVWDGGNNDFGFFRPDVAIVVCDALRPDQVASHHPGEACARMADIAVINKVDSAAPGDVERAVANLRAVNPDAEIVQAASPVRLDDPELVRGRRVLVVEDGPTITHGDMPHGAGFVAAMAAGAREIVDPRATLPEELASLYRLYPHIGPVLPAVGYGPAQLKALGRAIRDSEAEAVVIATPVDLARAIVIGKPWTRARYEFADAGAPTLAEAVARRLGF